MPIRTMHNGIYDSLSYHPLRQIGLCRRVDLPFFQRKILRQIRQDRINHPVNLEHERPHELNRRKTFIDIFYPLISTYTNIVRPHQRVKPSNNPLCSKKHGTRKCKVTILRQAFQRFQKFPVTIVEFFRLGINLFATSAVILDGIQIDIIKTCIFDNRRIETRIILIKGIQVFFCTSLVA